MRSPYEEGFNGSSYGFRPRYSQNNALDEVYVVLMQNKISCVRHTYLCGEGFQSRRDFEHRKVLASVFVVDVCAYARISSHYHNVRVYLLWFDRIVSQ